MYRSFEASSTRCQHILNGLWDFVIDPDDKGVELDYVNSFPSDTDQIDVPAAWNVSTEYYDYEGPAWYRKQFELSEKGTTRIEFAGVCHDADVWLDGEKVADHYGGYTPFEVVADLDTGEHELIVRADNSRDERSIPRPGTDWFPYGGITREVIVESVPSVYIDDLCVDYDLDGDHTDMTVTVVVRNEDESTEIPVRAEIGSESAEQVVTTDAGKTEVDLNISLDVERWSPDDPQLYEIVATIGTDDSRDELRERVGFRTVEVTDTDILVNDEPVEIQGINRHEDHPEWGHTQPLRLQKLDLDMIEDAGLNTVRTSHYPNHPRFLDLCDERGILVLEEIPYWQFDGERFQREGVLDRGKAMLKEMIERDRSHPSILAWSLTNECPNEEEAVYDATEELANLARDLDDRPITLASNNYHPTGIVEDICLEHVDFICANGYPGWYWEGDYPTLLEAIHEDYPEKPIVFSEFGAGAVYGERTRDNQKWSEGYQAEFLENAIEIFQETEYVSGFTIWQFCDIRTDPRIWDDRPKTKNNKGIVDEYRRPKEAYHRVSDLMNK